jgi:methyl-accepting chemotaxis protein
VIDPGEIPQFTGDLEQLEEDCAGLKADAGHVRDTGQAVHSRFQGLAAYYTAPEAEQLFATTKPVKDRADTFADNLETVSGALSAYATEIRPLVDRLKALKARATAFVTSVKDDVEWEYDGDKVEAH